MPKIYVASSWRNIQQPFLVPMLRAIGHEVYDFRNPAPDKGGFGWSQIDPSWKTWTAREYIAALDHPIAEAGYRSDMDAMMWADVCILLLPSGRSAHLEAGWMSGRGKRVFVLTRDGEEPELMAKMATKVCCSLQELVEELKDG